MSKKPSSSASVVWKSLILLLVLLLNAALVYRLFWGEQSVSAWRELKRTHAELGAELAALDSQRAALSREIRLLSSDDAYVEKVIRQRLNYVRKSEILYLFDEAKPEDSPWAGDGTDGRAE